MNGSQSPRKRQKVEFDMNLEIYEIGTRSVEEIKTEIGKALEAHARDENEEYDILKETLSGKQHFRDDDEDDDADHTLPEKRRQELKGYMIALTSFASHLGRSASSLVTSVLKCEWLGRDEQFAKVYIQFLAALVSAQGSYMGKVLASFVDRFYDQTPGDWSVPGFPTVSREDMQTRLHLGLEYLLQLFPAAPNLLVKLVTKSFPYHDEPRRSYVTYVNNLLRIRQYAPPQLEAEIIGLIIIRLCQIDVQMQLDLEDLDDEVTAMVALALKSSQEAAGNEEEDDDSDIESVDSEDDEDDRNVKVKTVKENIEKMDSIMDSLFRLYSPRFADPESDQAAKAFEDLLIDFSNNILPTCKSRHTQFLVFHFAQKSERLMDAFCGTCINIAFESHRPIVQQQAAAAYLASFVARGAKVPRHIVRSIFDVIGYRLDEMRRSYEPKCRGPDVNSYGPFYALMQALLYIFCFRWRDLIKSVPEDVDEEDASSYLGQEIEWETDIKDIFRRNIFSRLNPLKVCAPAIVDQFALLAHRFRFMYLYTLIESNKRLRLSQFVSNRGAFRESGIDYSDEKAQQLDSFFPFDPYQLPISKRWVEPDYLYWQPIPGLHPGDEDDSDDEVDAVSEADEVEDDTATDQDD